MSSLSLVMLFTVACVLFPQSATAQSQNRKPPRQSKTQIAFKALSASSINDGATNALNNSVWSNQSFDRSITASPSSNTTGNTSGDTWTGEQSGNANAYNYSDPSASQAGAEGGNGRGYDRVYDTYAMSAADVLAARRAVLNGSFFSYHGTQSSQTSRNR